MAADRTEWNDARLDDLARSVDGLLPLHSAVATLTTEIGHVRSDIGDLSGDLKGAKVGRANRRAQLIHGTIAAVLGGTATVVLTYIANGGIVIR